MEALGISKSSRSSSEALVVLHEAILSKSSEGVPLLLLTPRAYLFEANWSIINNPNPEEIVRTVRRRPVMQLSDFCNMPVPCEYVQLCSIDVDWKLSSLNN